MDAYPHPDPQQPPQQDLQQDFIRSRYLHPSKEAVRAWLARRLRDRLPPPPPATIRRELGWHVAQPALAGPTTPAALPLPLALTSLAALTLAAWCWSVICPGYPPPLSNKNDRGIS
ncbi:hypothetical protein [Pseudoduganella chitinolytica]|uniref:Uncharacterized protein n=1 Tax=Pseudoduganella chitinolytica TaxID=34070 RepID=A0ABY8B3Y3_9BURK|nr:hypothetical protein [Pseudoduganella chitinolytica]WEF30645.1 hypothetical protein PX653_14270 [Pseudoduganella chitinolytica]